MLFHINNTITAVCQVLGHQAGLVLEAVYKHVTGELLASLQQMKMNVCMGLVEAQ